jgi:hypothetical protein
MPSLKIKYLLFALLLHAGASGQEFSDVIARLDISRNGCFGITYQEKLFIYKDNGILKAKFESDSTAGQPITAAQFDYFNRFVEALKKFKSGGKCTHVENYTLYMNGTSVIRRDATCEWGGFDKLCKKLFAP